MIKFNKKNLSDETWYSVDGKSILFDLPFSVSGINENSAFNLPMQQVLVNKFIKQDERFCSNNNNGTKKAGFSSAYSRIRNKWKKEFIPTFDKIFSVLNLQDISTTTKAVRFLPELNCIGFIEHYLAPMIQRGEKIWIKTSFISPHIFDLSFTFFDEELVSNKSNMYKLFHEKKDTRIFTSPLCFTINDRNYFLDSLIKILLEMDSPNLIYINPQSDVTKPIFKKANNFGPGFLQVMNLRYYDSFNWYYDGRIWLANLIQLNPFTNSYIIIDLTSFSREQKEEFENIILGSVNLYRRLDLDDINDGIFTRLDFYKDFINIAWDINWPTEESNFYKSFSNFYKSFCKYMTEKIKEVNNIFD